MTNGMRIASLNRELANVSYSASRAVECAAPELEVDRQEARESIRTIRASLDLIEENLKGAGIQSKENSDG